MNTFEQNTGYMEFNIDGNIYTHDAIAYASNLSFKRVDMPQIGVYELLKNDMYKHLIRAYNVGIVHTILPISLLKPTQTDIDYDRVRIDIAKYGWDDKFQRPLLISNDMRIVDGHHQHVRWMITQPERITEVLIIDMPILELIPWLKEKVIPYFNITKSIPENFQLDEDFGMQGPEAIPGMGSVKMPEVVTVGNEMTMSGSGDIILAKPSITVNTNPLITKKDEDDVSVEEAIVIMHDYQNQKIQECQSLFALELDNQIMEMLDKNNDDGQKLISDLKSRVSRFLTSFGFKYNEDGKLTRYCKDSEGNESWVVVESMGDISIAHKYYPEFGGYFIQEEVESGHALDCYNNTHQSKFFTKDRLREIARKHREEHGENWLEKERERIIIQQEELRKERIQKLQSGEDLDKANRKLHIGQAIVQLSSMIYDTYGFDFTDAIMQFVNKEISSTKEYVYPKTLQESLNEAKDKQVPLDVHFTKEDVDSMTDLITCMNKPVKRRFKVIETAFSCQTLEGITHGKAGDCLVVGVDGEIYPCDKEIFDNTYVALEADKIQEEFLNANKRLLEAKEIIEKAEQAYIIGKLTNNC